MSVKSKLMELIEVIFEDDLGRPDPRATRPLDDDDIDAFVSAANERELQLFAEIEVLLGDLGAAHPLKTDRLRRDLRWLRRQAYARGIAWGRR